MNVGPYIAFWFGFIELSYLLGAYYEPILLGVAIGSFALMGSAVRWARHRPTTGAPQEGKS